MTTQVSHQNTARATGRNELAAGETMMASGIVSTQNAHTFSLGFNVNLQTTTIVALIATLFTACGEPDFELPEYTPNFGVVTQAIRHGSADENGQYPSIARLTIKVGDDFFLCSGTVISDRAILTAAHCVDNAAAASDIWAILDGQSARRVSEFVMHPNYSADAAHVRFAAGDVYRFSGPDLAILKFDSDLNAPITPLATQTPAEKDLLTIVGFGLNENMSSGTRRFGQVEYVGATETYAGDRSTVDSNAGSFITNPGPNNDGVCGGDSGGALFHGNAVLGVTSGGVLNNGDENVCVRMRNANFISVPAYSDWINTEIGATPAQPVIDDAMACDAYGLDQQHELGKAGSYSLNWGGLGEKWLTSRSGNWFYILPNGDLYRWNSNTTPPTGEQVATLNSAFHTDPTLLHDAQEIEAGCDDGQEQEEPTVVAQRAFDLDSEYGFSFNRSYATNWGGLGEKWITDRDSNWYYITPEGVVHRWNQDRPVGGAVIGSLSSAYHVTPSLLHDAIDPNAAGQAGCADDTPAAMAHDAQQTYAFVASGDYNTNWGGLGEKWISASNGTWFYITPAGGLFRWTKYTSPPEGTLIAQLGPEYFANPSLLINAAEPTAGNCGSTTADLTQVAENLDASLDLVKPNSYARNWGGRNEKWLSSSDGRWLFILPNGELYRWTIDSTPPTGTLIATLSSDYYNTPSLLHDAAN
jgi:hypothetical protein